jgi:hypothetical protein
LLGILPYTENRLMNRITKLTPVAFLLLIALPGCTRGVTEPQSPRLDGAAMSGIGWTGSGGRTDTTSVVGSEVGATTTGIGVFGGGGRTDSVSTQNSEAGIGVFGGGG